jgi:hypothetical protein
MSSNRSCTPRRLYLWEEPLPIKRALTLNQAVELRSVRAEKPFKHLPAVHAGETVKVSNMRVDPNLRQGLAPALRDRQDRIDECALHVEDNAAGRLQSGRTRRNFARAKVRLAGLSAVALALDCR